MKERPILFSGEMVRAILEGRKTQTRRVVNPRERKSPYGIIGDRLWVRETFAEGVVGCEEQAGYSYRADHWDKKHGDGPNKLHWISSIHMPRRPSRITLEVTGVRVERLQDITEEEAVNEGALPAISQADIYENRNIPRNAYRDGFATLWNSLAKPSAKWEDNPWVWVIEFSLMRNKEA